MLIFLSLLGILHAAPEIATPTIVRYAVESLNSKRAFLFYGALSGASADTLATLNRDLTRGFGATGLPALSLVSGEFFVNDQATGARIKTYQPFAISYRRETWSPLPRAPIDLNVLSLKKTLRDEAEHEEILALTGALLANMVENMNDAVKMGVGYGFMTSRPGPLGEGKWIASPEFRLECDDEITIITHGKHKVNVSSIILDNRSLYGYDARGRRMDLDLRPAEMIEMRKLRACDQDAKAKGFTSAIRQAATAAQIAIAQTKKAN